MENQLKPELLKDLITTPMPYGKYEGTKIYRIPVNYLEWMEGASAYPAGKLGMLLRTAHIIKTNGLEYLLEPLIKKY